MGQSFISSLRFKPQAIVFSKKLLNKGKSLNTILLFLSLLFPFPGLAQTVHTVKGNVTDVRGEPLAGVSIKLKSTNVGTTTDGNGNFSINVTSENDILVFTSIGFNQKEVKTGSGDIINVQLISAVQSLDEIVVVGYGTQKRGVVTSAISTVKQEDFTQGVVRGPLQLLRGKVAGLALSAPGGDPTGGTQINIRGVSTLASSSDPLIVIDGIPGGSLNAIAPEDIESIDVLKDASAAAIYGTRGNGGVIIVTTKKGKSNAATVTYNGYINLDEVAKRADVLSADQIRNIRTITGIQTLNVNDYGYATDWQDEILRNPVNQVHHLSVNGGSSTSNYIASVTYRTLDGILLNSDRKALIGRLSINHSALNDRLRFNFNISNNSTNHKEIWYNAYLSSVIRNPTDRVYNDDGSFTDYPSTPLNPVAQLLTETANNKYNQLLTSGRVTIEPIKDWNISATGSLQRFDNAFDKANDFRNQSTTLNHLNGQVWIRGNQNIQRTLELVTDYSRTFNEHHVTMMSGYSFQDFSNQHHEMYAYDFPTDVFGPWNINAANSTKDGLSFLDSYKSTSKLAAFFGRVNYDYKNKYMIMASLRREGSSKFGENHKWGLFPAISAGWRITDEPFMAGANFLNDLKLRVGFGVTGTQPDDPYLSIPTLGYGSRMYYNGEWIQSVQPTRNPNPDLRWERKEELNAGVDFSMFSRKLNGSIDVYSSTTRDLLYTYNVPVPPNLFNTILANVGSIRNEGIELTINSVLRETKSFNLSVGGNFSYNNNKLLKFSNDQYQLDFLNVGGTGAPVQQYTHRVAEDEEIGNFYGWRSIGVNENGQWIIQKPDGTATTSTVEADKQILGNGLPKMYAGLSADINYKRFDFSATLRGAFGFQILNQHRMMYETFGRIGESNQLTSVLNKPYNGDNYLTAAPQYVSYYIEDGDYIKIDNVTLGYTLPVINGNILKRLRLYISGLNLYTFTGYKGLDPEVSIKGLNPGTDFMNKYPSVKTFTFGVNASF